MTGLETAFVLGALGLLLIEPVRRVRDYRARTHPVNPLHRSMLVGVALAVPFWAAVYLAVR